MDLALQGLPDPAVQCNVAVIYWWAMSRWDRVLELGIIDGTLDKAAAGVEHQRPWGSCKGPAEVLVATLRRIGWTILTPCIWQNAVGQRLHLDEVCPRDIKKLALLDAGRRTWERAVAGHAMYQHLQGPPLIEPIIGLLKKEGPGWGSAQKRALSAFVSGAIHGGGLCVCCGRLNDYGNGLIHIWECPSLEGHHSSYWSELPNPRADATCPHHGFWATGVATDPRHTLPLPLVHDLVIWTIRPSAGRLHGPAYGDGSGLHGRSLLSRRCGWGLCTVDE